MSTEIDELKQARYRSDKTISGHNAFLRPPTGETNSVDTRGFYFVRKEPHPILIRLRLLRLFPRRFIRTASIFRGYRRECVCRRSLQRTRSKVHAYTRRRPIKVDYSSPTPAAL